MGAAGAQREAAQQPVLIVQEETPVVGVIPAACIEEETAAAPAITMEIEESAAAEQVVTPWEVSAPAGVIDYVKAIGCSSLRGGGGELGTLKVLNYGSN